MRKLKIYLDTSVINFLFADDAPDYMKATIDFFDNYLNEFDAYISDVVLAEIKRTPDAQKRASLFDILLSWNFKHLSNIKKQKEINIVNLNNGYLKPLILVNPLEVIYEK